MRTGSLLVYCGIALLLVACGQKGALVLPDAQHPRKKIAVPKAPQPPPPIAAPGPAATATAPDSGAKGAAAPPQ